MNPIPIAKPLIGDEEQAAVRAVLESGQLAAGDEVAAFEREFAAGMGAKHAVAVANGTLALQNALQALGVGPGDEVLVPAFTFIATANAVCYTGATPVLVDVDPATFLMDPEKAAAARTARTKVALPVHLFGQAAPLAALQEALGEDVMVLGDAAQAHGAEHDGRPIGGTTAAQTWSLYPTKNMTSGEGGMITTDDDGFAAVARSIANQGRGRSDLGTYDHVRLGSNHRLTNVHAAIGRVQLRRLPDFNDRRRALAARYDEAFTGLDTIHAPVVAPGNRHVYHQYTLRCDDRAHVRDTLEAAGVGSGIYYPKALHQYPHLARFGHDDLAVSERLAEEVLSIPVHPAVTDTDAERVIEAVRRADGPSQR